MALRDQKWDNVKFILIFLVVLGHIADIYADISPATGYIRFFIYMFHMPLFIFVSGLFSKKNVKYKRYDKIFSYLVLYVFIKILIFISRWIGEGKMPAFRLFYEGSAPWYAFTLFAFCLITIFTDRFDPKYIFAISVILALAAGYDNRIGDHFCLSRIIVYYPFFFAGYLLEPAKVKEFFDRWYFKLASAFVIAVSFIIIVNFYDEIKDIKFLFTGRNSYYDVFKWNSPYAFLIRALCYVISAVLGCCIISLTPENFGRGIPAKIGENSVQIYALHYPLKVLWFSLVSDRFHIDALFTSKLVLYEIIVSVVLMALCILPFWKPVFRKVLKG